MEAWSPLTDFTLVFGIWFLRGNWTLIPTVIIHSALSTLLFNGKCTSKLSLTIQNDDGAASGSDVTLAELSLMIPEKIFLLFSTVRVLLGVVCLGTTCYFYFGVQVLK